MQINLSFYKSAKDNKGTVKSLDQIIKFFSGNKVIEEQTQYYRTLTPGKTKDDYKVSRLEAVTWSGTFSKRLADNLIQHSNLICIDIDKLSQEQHDSFKKLLKLDANVFFLFTSPSGLGLKIIFKIQIPTHNENKEAITTKEIQRHHRTCFRSIEAYISAKYGYSVDGSGKDVSRLCFICHDTDYYYNAICNDFPISEWLVEDEQPEPLTQTEGENLQATGTLQDIFLFTEKKTLYVPGNHNAFIYLFACNCNRRAIDIQECLDYTLSFAINKDTKEVADTVNSAYKHNKNEYGKFAKRQQKGAATKVSQKSSHGEGEGNKATELENIGTAENYTKFWSERNVKRGKGEDAYTTTEYSLKRVEFVDFLFEQGFHLIDTDNKGGYQLCYSKDGTIDPVEPRQIKRHVFTWCKQNVVRAIEEMMREKQRSIFNAEELNSLHTKNIVFKTDTESECFFYFKNCWVTVTAQGVTTRPYSELKEFIWLGNKKEHVFEQKAENWMDENNELHLQNIDCEFARFVFLAAWNPNSEEEKNFTQLEIQQRFLSFCSAIGYMMDGYKHPSDRKAIIALDHKVSEKGEKHGRTGKSIIPKACERLKVVSTINGKTFDPRYQFRYEVITADSQIINFNDMKGNFDIEEIFEVIADDYSVIRRQNGYLHFKYENSPKVWLSMNAIPKGGDTSSYAGRMNILEFSDYFTPDHTPFTEFGHGLFSSAWSAEEWQKFYNFMLWCVELYKLQGFIQYPKSNLNERRLKSEVDVEFIDFMDDWERDKREDKKPKLEALRKLLMEANGGGKPLSANGFCRAIKTYCKSKGLFFNPHIPAGKYDKVGGVEYYTIATTPDFVPTGFSKSMF